MILRTLPFAMLPIAAFADAPTVVTDIAPIHSLTAMVMDGVGTPHLLLPPNADPHSFALRPSDAAHLEDAQVIVWVGHALSPWLEAPLETLAPDAINLELMETRGWEKLAYAEDAHEDHEDHEEDHGDGHNHAGEFDPHAWLSPTAASVWVAQIAESLSTADPANASTYTANAAAAATRLTSLSADITESLHQTKPTGFVLPHAAMQYFETEFGVTAAGTISNTDAADPGPAHIAELKAEMGDVTCVLHDPQNDKWARLLTEGTGAKMAPLDLMGSTIPLGVDHYAATIRAIADTLQDCTS